MSNEHDIKTIGVQITGKDNVFINCTLEGFDKGIDLKDTAKRNKFIDTEIIAGFSVLPNKKLHQNIFANYFLTILRWIINLFINLSGI